MWFQAHQILTSGKQKESKAALVPRRREVQDREEETFFLPVAAEETDRRGYKPEQDVNCR